ncbi:MAG: hypothetical protein Q8943_17395 [Bacteroidota bacterium]|nr:hypothetical protein [Bacteroidota bacterium]
MMPIDFEGANITFTKPEGWTDEQCSELRVMRTEDGRYVSVWKPNVEDIKAINEGRPICLSIFSNSHPPVSLFTYNELGEHN